MTPYTVTDTIEDQKAMQRLIDSLEANLMRSTHLLERLAEALADTQISRDCEAQIQRNKQFLEPLA